MALYLSGNDFAFYASPDLERWEHLQTITVPGCAECPDFFQMPIENEPGKAAFVWTNANAKYLVGQFDGTSFAPDGGFHPIQSEFNDSFYAGQTFSNLPDQRRIQIGWLRNGKYPGMPFNQQLSFPTVLTLRRTSEGLRVFRKPIDEIRLLRETKVERHNEPISTSPQKLSELKGKIFDIDATIDPGKANRVGLRVRGQEIVFDRTKDCAEQPGARQRR